MDVLRELCEDEISYILEQLEKRLPYTIKDIYFIKTSLNTHKEAVKNNYKILSDKMLPRFYTCQNGKKENCTIMGITGEGDHTVWYFTLDDTLNEIRECLKTRLIKWNKLKILFVTIHVEQIQPILEYVAKHKLILKENEYASYYKLSRESALLFNIMTPDGVVIRKLEVSDAVFVNSKWKFQDEKSEIWIKSMIEINGGYALIDRVNKEILSYAIFNDHRGIGALTTLDGSKRKGYAEIIVKYMAKEIASTFKLDPIAFIQDKNHKSLNLFQKLGFQRIGGSNWIIVEPSENF